MSRRLTNSEFIKQAKAIHGNTYSYSNTRYVTNKQRLVVTCRLHGDFSQLPNNHLRGAGCNKCGTKRTSQKKTIPYKEFLRRARIVHGDRYEYHGNNYVNMSTKTRITCRIHGDFWQLPDNHVSKGSNCSRCGDTSVSICKTLDTKYFIRMATEVHGDTYDYSQSKYKRMKARVLILCPTHGAFYQTPDKHLMGRGCPKCVSVVSKGEQRLADFLREFTTVIQSDKETIPPYEIDILLPEHNMGIEYNGNYWHSEAQHKRARTHLLEKQELCKNKGIRIIHVMEYEDELLVKKTLSHVLGINKERYFARKCRLLKESSTDTHVKKFFVTNHLQGNTLGCEAYSLYLNNQLVASMLFSKTNSERGVKRSTTRYELRRFTSVCRIVGGASRLLKAFIREHPDCDTILSYSDSRWFTGGMYESLGFDLIHITRPEYKYWKGNKINSKNSMRRSRLKSRKDIVFRPRETEKENATRNGWHRIWDCGKKKWELQTRKPATKR